MKPNTDADVIIIGSGLVGLSLAAALLQGGLRVILLDSSDTPQAQPVALNDPTVDQRVYAISRASENIFRALPHQQHTRVWDAMQAQRVSPYQDMHVWENRAAIHFSCTDIHEENLGHIIEQQVMLAVLQQAVQTDGVQRVCSAQLHSFSVQKNCVQVALHDGRTFTAAVLVGADGAQSQVREQAGIRWDSQDYGHHALVATVRTELPHTKTAWQRFLPTGPLAFLPLHEAHTSSIVWSTEPAQAKKLLRLPEPEFQQALEQAFAQKLGRIESVQGRALFPLIRRHAREYVQPRLALVGDALRTIHPLAGQGVNLGLLDATTLAEVLIDAQQQQHDLGHYQVLRRYERWRKGHNLLMLAAMDSFKTLFSNDFMPLRWVRSLGLNWADKNALLKQQLMLQAMGINGDLPRLARWSGVS